MRLIGVDASSDEAVWRPIGVSCTLYQLYCNSCNQCCDLEVCQESFNCQFCKSEFSSETVESLLVNRVNQLLLSFTLQDFKCIRCNSVIFFSCFFHKFLKSSTFRISYFLFLGEKGLFNGSL